MCCVVSNTMDVVAIEKIVERQCLATVAVCDEKELVVGGYLPVILFKGRGR